MLDLDKLMEEIGIDNSSPEARLKTVKYFEQMLSYTSFDLDELMIAINFYYDGCLPLAS